ncbi:MAG: hypothetical protein AAFV36_07515 [Myxococcota bacterium]
MMLVLAFGILSVAIGVVLEHEPVSIASVAIGLMLGLMVSSAFVFGVISIHRTLHALVGETSELCATLLGVAFLTSIVVLAGCGIVAVVLVVDWAIELAL